MILQELTTTQAVTFILPVYYWSGIKDEGSCHPAASTSSIFI